MAELTTIARPYAEALFQVARQGDVSVWAQQIEALAQVAQHPQVRQFSESPKASEDQVVDLVTTAVQLPLLPGVQNFLRTVVANGRLVALPAIAEQFHGLVSAASGVSDAVIYSPYPIEPAQLAEVVSSLEKRFGRKLSASVVLEPELIGGIRVVVGDEVLDTSVKARLERMKVALSA
ncbi:F0F1 ATP synthase subunit delta [Sphaerotilus sp.]|uniref:F0F1 ATP synthase subunit delta n=1 Tax=Sphaerotilus sp. TaxID=2093942 RepID=UPI002ACE32B7|nr:F0F1 ATP synthase subunit delta [Sphaerotilus sp.]MDZ7857430.1 F0F1 ATP synthase subunit delta [Sphaerotilus sp.]